MKGLEPDALAGLLRDAVLVAHEAIDVERLARLSGGSRRSVARELGRAGWPPPAEFILWSRLLRAGLANHGSPMTVVALARVGGFVDADALTRACDNLLGLRGALQGTLSAGRVGMALRARLAVRED